MRIEPKPITPVTLREPSDRAATPPAAPPPSEPSAVVSLSRAAVSAAATSSFDSDFAAKIERLRVDIERGDYNIDLEVLTSKIVDDDLLRKG